MARQVIEHVVSDLSGEVIPPGSGWVMVLTPADGRKNPVRLDLTDGEAREFVSRGTEVKRRGRRPGSTAGSKTTSANGRRKLGTAKVAAKRRNPSGNGRRKQGSAAKTTAKRKTRSASGRRKRRSRPS